MPESYLTSGCQIHMWKESGESKAGIARRLGRHPIGRELSRNADEDSYDFKRADRLATERRRMASEQPRKMTSERWGEVDEKLALQWSPEQISGRIEGRFTVSHEWIYRHVWKDREAGGTLFRHLRRRGKKRNSRAPGQAGRGCGRVDIAERPEIVEEKSRVGDWEGDTIVGARHRGAVLSLVDRASKFTLLALLGGRTAGETCQAIRRRLEPGVRAHDHDRQRQGVCSPQGGLDALFFFAEPSWERGLNEHTNGLVRQYFPKATDNWILPNSSASRPCSTTGHARLVFDALGEFPVVPLLRKP